MNTNLTKSSNANFNHIAACIDNLPQKVTRVTHSYNKLEVEAKYDEDTVATIRITDETENDIPFFRLLATTSSMNQEIQITEKSLVAVLKKITDGNVTEGDPIPAELKEMAQKILYLVS